MSPDSTGASKIVVVGKHQPGFVFDLTGGQLALDLANTVSLRSDPEQREEHLEGYRDLLAFARQSGVISARQAGELHSYAEQHASLGRRSFAEAIELREAIYRAFSAIAQGKSATAADLDLITQFAVEALRHRVLSRADGGYRWQWQPQDSNPLDRILWPMSQAAADLLTSAQLRIVRFCEAPDCEWLFLDHSRNRSRRWCDMTTCGNRQKARRHYRRSREG
jgi:predicted RNA-binding Zn ribbon-like protein